MFKLVKRTDVLQGSDRPFVAFRAAHICFSDKFCRLADIDGNKRVSIFVNEEDFQIGFRFHQDKQDTNSLSLSRQGKKTGGYCCTISDLKNLPWMKEVINLPMTQRRFDPELTYTPEQGKLWMVQICPAFENKKPRDGEIPNKGGIYRYKRAGETVYIGRGNIAERAREPQRKEWDFDLVEYSLVTNPDEQTKWEYYWIERYKEEEGRLPIYNKISGAKP